MEVTETRDHVAGGVIVVGEVDEMFFNNSELQQARQGEVGLQINWFYGLKTIKLVNSEVQPCAIPAHILPYLNSLKELEVRDCKQVKVIFYMKDSENVRRASSKLQKLTLEGLPLLTHVWEKNCQGILSFQNLQHVFVKECEKLETVFPTTLAKNLKKLQHLEVESCGELQQIIGEVKDAATGVIEKFVFPHLTTLDLYDLPQLTYVCPEELKVELPALNMLRVLYCDNLELFPSAHPEGEGDTSGASINRQFLSSDLKAISKLQRLTLDLKHASVLRQLEGDLQYLNYVRLKFDGNENVNPSLLIEILEKAPNIQEMTIECCRSLEMFLTPNSQIAEHGMLGKLKILKLDKVSDLQSFGSEDSPWLNAICEKLHELCVMKCPDFTTLIHSTSTVSFSYLKELRIVKCHRLLYLFTCSTAKMLMHLEFILVKECDSIKEIVAKEQEEITSDGIKFERLDMIVLSSLSSLKCFYSGIDTLDLPSLIKVKILQCPKLDNFSLGLIDAKSFEGIQISDNLNEDLVFHDGLNSSVKRVFLLQGFLQAMDIDCLSDDHPELQEARLGSGALQNKWLRELVTLKLRYCILPYAIPSSILPYLKNLKELEVRYCNAVKVIFDMNDTQIMETAVQLEKLHLEGLSELTHVWEKNSQGVLFFQNLQHVIVKSCDNLETLFPTALAKNLKKLKELKIESCDKLLDIVEKEEDAAANVTENFVFPCLKMLDLNDLPQFTYFYPQTFTLECPALNNLNVLDCPKLELFQSAHPEGEGEGSGTSITRQPLLSYLKVISNLEEFSLDWKHISALTLRLRSGQFTEGLKYLNDISLYFDADENEEPFLPTEVLQNAPNLKELFIGYCNRPEIIHAPNLKIGDDGMLGQLRIFTLAKVSELQSINSEDSSWLNAIFEKLHELNVFECPDLKTLIPSTSTVSFSCLRIAYNQMS